MQHLEGSGTPVLYAGRTVLKGESLTMCIPEENIVAQAFSLTTTTSASDMQLPSFPSVKNKKKPI
jgi:hypothetical protein